MFVNEGKSIPCRICPKELRTCLLSYYTKMKLSIITINYNNAEGLCKTLESVVGQTYRNFEHVIVDGGSTDKSVEVIKQYETHVRSSEQPFTIKWLSEPDNGIYNAMNKGIRRASGDYIQILNSGDALYAADVTERMIAALSTSDNNQMSILYGNMIRDYGNGKVSRDICLGDRVEDAKPHEVEWTMYDFIKGTVNHDPTYIHRSLYEKYGLYDENLKICSDWKWFVNAVVFGGEKLYYVPIDVTLFDTTGISETQLEFREKERHGELEKLLPAAILKDYDRYHFPIAQYKRLKKHHLWSLVYFWERVLFKLEKWHILK